MNNDNVPKEFAEYLWLIPLHTFREHEVSPVKILSGMVDESHL